MHTNVAHSQPNWTFVDRPTLTHAPVRKANAFVTTVVPVKRRGEEEPRVAAPNDADHVAWRDDGPAVARVMRRMRRLCPPSDHARLTLLYAGPVRRSVFAPTLH